MIEFTCIGKVMEISDLKETQSGLKYCTMILKANRSYANADGVVESDDYSLTCWKQLAEDMVNGDVVSKTVYVRGRLQANNYHKDDTSYFRADLIASNIIMLP